MSLEKNLDFMDFVKDAAFTADPAKEGWVTEFLKKLCIPNQTAGELCNFLQKAGYEGVRIKDCQTLLDVAKQEGKWRTQIRDLEETDY